MARRDDTGGATDPTRREFFRTFGRQTVRNAGAMIGAAAELRRAGGAAARELLDMDAEDEVASTTRTRTTDGDTVESQRTVGGEPAPSFRSAYRLAGDALLILDQRDLPGRMTILTCSEPTEVASAITVGAINSGPVLAEIAGYALAAVVTRSAGQPVESRDQLFHAAADTLRGARREVHALRLAVDRMQGRYDAMTADGSAEPQALIDAIRAEADWIAAGPQLAHAALGRSGAELISAAAAADSARASDEPINLLMHGDAGPLSCGMVGTGTAVLQSLTGLGHRVHVWLTEAAPGMEGSRVAALQLTQIDVPHTLIADSAVGWLLGARRLDGVLLRGDTVAMNGETVTLIGSQSVAQLAAASSVPVYVLAPLSAFDEEAADAHGLTLELRSPAEALAGTVGSDGQSRPAVFGVRLNPTTDVVPGALVTAFLTENGPRTMAGA